MMDRIIVAFALLCPCLAAVESCEDLYYGKHDYARALPCFQAAGQWDYVALLYLNGEGRPRDLAKAEQALAEWKRAEPRESSPEAAVLAGIIATRKAKPAAAYAPIDYCRDIARSPDAVALCAVRRRDANGAPRLKLESPERLMFDRIVTEFQAFRKAEEMRVYLLNVDGTLRGPASVAQGEALQRDFDGIVRIVIERHTLPQASASDFAGADRKLNRLYQKLGRDHASAEYAAKAREAELHWIAYRDLWAGLAGNLYGKPRAGWDPALSIKTLLTRARAKELALSPFGGR